MKIGGASGTARSAACGTAMRVSRTEIPQRIHAKPKTQGKAEPKAATLPAPRRPFPAAKTAQQRPPEQRPRRAILCLSRNRRFADMFLGHAGSAASQRNAALRSASSRAALNLPARNRFRRPAAGATAGSCFFLSWNGNVGALPQTPQRAPPLDPARGSAP